MKIIVTYDIIKNKILLLREEKEMKIKSLKLKEFMLFEDLEIDWSSNINIICGENSTGKTSLLKVMYATIKPFSNGQLKNRTKEQVSEEVLKKIQGVFRPDEMKIGRLVKRKRGSNQAKIQLSLKTNEKNIEELEIEFGSRKEKHLDLKTTLKENTSKFDPVYIPPKEMISATEHFQTLYEEYHLDFEEMYYDLAKLLDRPLKRGANTQEQLAVLKSFEEIVNGNIIQKDKKFYLKVKGKGEFEMGLVSEGYRKLATILYLISSGSLNKNSILFWDEPETNMNPKMAKSIVEAIVELAKMGVQIFITTHDYFIQQAFNMIATYPKANKNKLEVKFISLYFDKSENENLNMEIVKEASELQHNSIMEEFNEFYNREQDLIYDNE